MTIAPDVARTLVSAAPTLMSAFLVGHALACPVERSSTCGRYFSGFASSRIETAKPEKFVAYRKRRPERPPAGKIACHTKEARAIVS